MNRIILAVIIAVMLFPLWFMVTGSFQDIYGVFVMPPQLIPKSPTLKNYRWAFSNPLLGWFKNTVIVTVSRVLLAVTVAATGGYCFAFYRFPGKRILWAVLLAGIMVPRMSMIIPMFIVMRKLNLSGTLAAVILPGAYMPVGLYLSRAYFETVPKSIMDSAKVDGAGELRILTRIIAPISKPIITTVALFSAIAALGDYLWQMLQLQKTGTKTLLVGLIRATMKRGGGDIGVNPIGYSLAAAVILAVPLLVIFLIANKYFVSALSGAVKE